jgi:hypothetical protein
VIARIVTDTPPARRCRSGCTTSGRQIAAHEKGFADEVAPVRGRGCVRADAVARAEGNERTHDFLRRVIPAM